MNYLQKHKWLMAISVCIATILSGITTAVFCAKLDFSTAWIKTGFLMSFVGSGGIGVVIAFYVHSIPHQDKYRRKRLEVKAWKDLGMYFYSLIVGAVSFYFLIQKGGNERNLLIVVLALVMGIWVSIGQFVMKKRMLKGLDERERLIHEKAKMISDSIFGGLVLMGLLGLWGWMGFKAFVPVYIPIIIVFGLGAITEILKPVLILIQCKMEQNRE